MTDHNNMILGYPLLRSNRRSISIKVDKNGQVSIHAPLFAPEADIRRFVADKQAWIQQAQSKQRLKKELAPKFAVGETMPYLGAEIRVCIGAVRSPVLTGNVLTVPQRGKPEQQVLKWLGLRAKEYLPPRIAQWSEVMGCTPASLTIANPKTRWGSMKSDGSLRLNVALMLCPPALIDYVIVHELSHMVHMNHSPAFHAHVARYLPDAEARRKALKQLGGYLTYFREE